MTIGTYILRGTINRVFFEDAKGVVMIGKGVTLRYRKHLKAGKDLIIEEYAEINCLSNKKIVLGDRVTIGRFAIVRPSNSYGGPVGEGLKIGNNSNLGAYNYVGCSGYIEIGNDVMLGPRVGLYAENHNFEDPTRPIKEQGVTRKFIVIEDNCWIGANSVIVAGVIVGRGSVVAAGSIVTKDVPPFSIVAGSPAKIIKNRI
ncbi:MAG: acyltransferase [Leeuwenhoekiella sp.]